MLCYAAWAWPYEQKISKKVVSQKEVELTPYIPGKNLQSFWHAVAQHGRFQKGQEYNLTHPVLAVYRAESGRRLVLNLMEDL